MPTQVYNCPTNGEFDVTTSFRDDVLPYVACPDCGAASEHVLYPPAGIKVKRDWNEQANEFQRTPYTQAKAQAEHMYHEQRDAGVDVSKPTEADVQRAAAKIAEST